MEALEVIVERTGFPLKIAGIEFFFDASIEGIEKYETDFMTTVGKLDDLEESGNPLEDRKVILKQAYNTILGKGAFERIYKKIPDVIALTSALFSMTEGIDKHVALVVNEQMKKSDALVEEYENKFD